MMLRLSETTKKANSCEIELDFFWEKRCDSGTLSAWPQGHRGSWSQKLHYICALWWCSQSKPRFRIIEPHELDFGSATAILTERRYFQTVKVVKFANGGRFWSALALLMSTFQYGSNELSWAPRHVDLAKIRFWVEIPEFIPQLALNIFVVVY